MCFGIGISFLLAIIEVLPFLCLVTVPLLGSFFGTDVIYRLSLLLIFHSVIVEFIPDVLCKIIPLFNLVLFGLMTYLPFSLTPWPMVWLYGKIMWLTDPFLMIAEMVLVQNVAMRYSQSAAEEIWSKDGDEFKFKIIILIFSSMCYAISASLAVDIYHSAPASQVLCLFVTLVLLIAVHNMMWMAHEGIISDCAFCCLCSVTIIYAMFIETRQMNSPLEEPSLWKSTDSQNSSFLQSLSFILQLTTGHAQGSIEFLKRFFSPFFLGLFAIRLYSILFIVKQISKNFFQGDEDFDKTLLSDDDEEEFSPWKSPLLLKVSIIFMLTQMTANFLQEWTGVHSGYVSFLSSYVDKVWPSEILISRLLQVLAVNTFYIWRLYRADDWTWNPWLTP